MRSMLCVDPGMNTGWALFSEKAKVPKLHGVFRLSRQSKPRSDIEQIAELSGEFRSVLNLVQPAEVVIEGVAVYGNSAVSMASATRGNLSKLSYLVGAYTQCCFQIGIQPEVLLAREWKGQLNDESIKERVEMVCGQYYKEHERDAVAIGLYKMGNVWFQ